LTILFPFESSRFSGQISRIYKGITKKDISMLFCIEFLRREGNILSTIADNFHAYSQF